MESKILSQGEKEDMFVDTSGWYEFFIPTDPRAPQIRESIFNASKPLITTEYVVDELLTLLKARNRFTSHGPIWAALNNTQFVNVLAVTKVEVEAGYEIYSRFADKDWSFTDCLSYYFIRTLKIKNASSLDRHFHEFGIVSVRP